ncbi:MAG: geranylgeranyl reductase family protein [bacterium]|nr:geranylgeranyl reductase family protein [bacterium]
MKSWNAQKKEEKCVVNKMSREVFDVVVIGGGPAGASSAYYAAKAGLETAVFDKRAFPRPKPCGGCLSGRCLPLLGKHALESVNSTIDEFRLYAPSFEFFAVDDVPGAFIRRESFDEAMVKDAVEAGARFTDNCPVKSVTSLADDGYEVVTAEKTVQARYIIMASGFQKNALSRPFLTREPWDDDYLAMCAVSETPVQNGVFDELGVKGHVLSVFMGAVPNGYGWCFVKDGCVNIGIGATAVLIKDVGAGEYYKRFVRSLADRRLLPPGFEPARERLFPLPFKKTVDKTVFGNTLLVGDAAGFVNPISGEGIYYAIKGGQLAAQAIGNNLRDGVPLSSYRKEWRNAFGTDLDTHGYEIREAIYKSESRMEFAISLGKADRGIGVLLEKMFAGDYSCRETKWRALARLPIALLKRMAKPSLPGAKLL